ncbi:hypothetical protein Tco_1515010 [Tanacetum coccineum]
MEYDSWHNQRTGYTFQLYRTVSHHSVISTCIKEELPSGTKDTLIAKNRNQVVLRKNTLNGCNSGHNKREARKINLSTNEVPKITDVVRIKKLQILHNGGKVEEIKKKIVNMISAIVYHMLYLIPTTDAE